MAFQIGAALLDACVLSMLDNQDLYGYELTQRIRQVLEVSESTLYPVLRRLQKENYLTTYDKEFNGRNRRYYSITEEGRNRLVEDRSAWIVYRDGIDGLMKGEVQ